MAMAESASKVCVVCGQNVAGKPRVKDAAGRYMCAGACQEKMAASAKQAPPASAPRVATSSPTAATPPPTAKSSGDGSLLNDLISSSPMLTAASCQQCGSPMPGAAVICTRCGFNTQTGKALKTAVIKEKVVAEPGEKKKSRSISINGWVIFAVASVIAIGAGILPVIDIELGVVSLITLVVLGLAAFITACATVYEDGDSWMISIFFALRIGQRFLARTGQGGSIIAGVMELALVAFILIFVDSPLAKALTGAVCLGWLTLGVSCGMVGKTIESLINL
jgi:hypothetical protein